MTDDDRTEWQVEGADRETGKAVTFRVRAKGRAGADREAARRGVLVSRVGPVFQADPVSEVGGSGGVTARDALPGAVPGAVPDAGTLGYAGDASRPTSPSAMKEAEWSAMTRGEHWFMSVASVVTGFACILGTLMVVGATTGRLPTAEEELRRFLCGIALVTFGVAIQVLSALTWTRAATRVLTYRGRA